ncbi:Inositol-1-monophosphatase [Seminavis robusta]|uniref:Inositol-1-monophosphatase n=1 Tax=Seminavis robusta TaxID=568900 RepID=A0A9N8EUZ5_9STRA|nr:Inositol-1-monophosphatase [Seminavis robusta]|eukprot:Sro2055_g312790.1 Inositol-1-monophosphatase (336) ;mRNA; r:4694-5701
MQGALFHALLLTSSWATTCSAFWLPCRSIRPCPTYGGNAERALRGGDGGDGSNDNDVLLDDILQVALTASAKAAGIIAIHSDGSDVVETKSTSRDLLTLIDPMCEKAIRETVLERFPHHGFLGEEGVPPGIQAAEAALEEKLAASTDWLWIVDPIDGTTNFASGIPLNAPSVAVAYKGEIMVGVIHDPHRDEIWTAVRGRGAFLNGKPIIQTSSSSTSIGDAVIGAESPAGQHSLEVAVKGITALMPRCRTVRILGSTAVQLPWVAQGRLTCYWSPDECAWDHAAGAIIVQEAGGIITDLDGSPFTLRTRKFMASQNEQVHREVLQVLKDEAGIQ